MREGSARDIGMECTASMTKEKVDVGKNLGGKMNNVVQAGWSKRGLPERESEDARRMAWVGESSTISRMRVGRYIFSAFAEEPSETE